MNTVIIAMLLEKYSHLMGNEPKHSYYSPTNLFIMDLNNDLTIERYDKGCCLIRTLPITDQRVVSFVGPVSKAIFDRFQDSPDIVIESTVPFASFTVDRDNAEYVYDVTGIVNLKGARYKEVRRKYNSINNQIVQIIQINKLNCVTNSSLQANLWRFFEEQRRTKDINAQVEAMAFEKWLLFADQLPTKVVTVLHDDKVIGFSVIEVLNKTLLIHFFKTEHTVVGLAEYLFLEIARMHREEVEWINFQQDLGIEGLIQFKNHLQPSLQLLSFILGSD